MSSVGPRRSIHTIAIIPSADDTSVDPSAMFQSPPRSLEPEFTGDEGLTVALVGDRAKVRCHQITTVYITQLET
jgi:hypothetical protein